MSNVMSAERQRPLSSQGTLVRNAVLLSFAAVFFTIYSVQSLFELAIVAGGLLLISTLALPIFVRQRISPAEPVVLLLPLLMFGASLKLGLMVVVGFDHPLVADKLLVNRPETILLNGVFALLVACSAYSLCYLFTNRPFRVGLPTTLLRPSWVLSRVRMVLFFLAFVSGLATILLVARFQITSVSGISAKRFNDLDGGSQTRFLTVDYWLFRIALLGRFALYLWIPFAERLSRPTRGAGVALLLTVAIVPSILINNRAGLGLIAADYLLISYFVRGRFVIRGLLVWSGAAVAGVLALLGYRGGSGSGGVQLLESTFFGRDFLDVSKTSQIVTYGDGGALGGETYVGWLFTLVPSGVWEDPPLFAGLGRYVWQNVYEGGGLNGIPAGLVGEAYLNFGWAGVLIVPGLLGLTLRKIYLTFRPHLHCYGAAIIYSLVVIRFGVFAWSNDIGTGITKTLLDVVPVFLILRFVGSAKLSDRTPALPSLQR